MTRFLCTGDLHLGAGADYGREPGDRLLDQEAIWARILTLAEDHDVDVILFAGDAFHRRRPTPAELIAFQRPLRRLSGLDLLAIDGNHDVESAELPSALSLFDGTIELHREPDYWIAPGEVTVVTLPWTPISKLIADRDGGDRSDTYRDAAQALLTIARGFRAQIAGRAVLMLHWSVSGATTPTGAETDSFDEVVLPLGDLEALGFDAIVCGHIHKPQILHGGVLGQSGPIFYTGSPSVVDFGEAASEHGVWILDIEGNEPATLEFIPIDGRPFITLEADYTDGDDFSQLVEGYGDWSHLNGSVVRLRYTANEEQARRIDLHRIRQAISDAGAHKLYSVQPNIIKESRVRVDLAEGEDLGPMDAVSLWAEAQTLTDWERDSLNEIAARLTEAVGS